MADQGETEDGGDRSTGPVRDNLKATRAYGCLFALLLGGALAVVVFLGNVMGDCSPGPDCHDNEGAHILADLSLALPIAAVLGVGVWLLTAALRAALRPFIAPRLLVVLLVALTLALVWFEFRPAFELFFRLADPGGR